MKIIPWDGQRISQPGIYADVPLNDYHRGDICDGPSISSTGLRTLWNQSPAHYWDTSPLNPNRADEGDRAHFRIGRAVHHLALGEKFFSKEFVLRPRRAPDGRDWNGNNLSCKEWIKHKQRLGLTILKEDEAEACIGMCAAIRSHPLWEHGLLQGYTEHSLFWRDDETGVWLKARPDDIPTDSGDYADLKTTESVQYLDLQRSIATYGYHQQAALVLQGAMALDLPVQSFTFVWVEKKRPHCVRVQTLKDEDITRGAQQNRVSLRTFHQCFVAKSWPGPGEQEDAEYLDLPDWKRSQIDERLRLQMGEAA